MTDVNDDGDDKVSNWEAPAANLDDSLSDQQEATVINGTENSQDSEQWLHQHEMGTGILFHLGVPSLESDGYLPDVVIHNPRGHPLWCHQKCVKSTKMCMAIGCSHTATREYYQGKSFILCDLCHAVVVLKNRNRSTVNQCKGHHPAK